MSGQAPPLLPPLPPWRPDAVQPLAAARGEHQRKTEPGEKTIAFEDHLRRPPVAPTAVSRATPAEPLPAAMTAVEIVVPEGLGPGDAFDVEWGGVTYSIAVPDGCFGGTALNIELPSLDQSVAKVGTEVGPLGVITSGSLERRRRRASQQAPQTPPATPPAAAAAEGQSGGQSGGRRHRRERRAAVQLQAAYRGAVARREVAELLQRRRRRHAATPPRTITPPRAGGDRARTPPAAASRPAGVASPLVTTPAPLLISVEPLGSGYASPFSVAAAAAAARVRAALPFQPPPPPPPQVAGSPLPVAGSPLPVAGSPLESGRRSHSAARRAAAAPASVSPPSLSPPSRLPPPSLQIPPRAALFTAPLHSALFTEHSARSEDDAPTMLLPPGAHGLTGYRPSERGGGGGGGSGSDGYNGYGTRRLRRGSDEAEPAVGPRSPLITDQQVEAARDAFFMGAGGGSGADGGGGGGGCGGGGCSGGSGGGAAAACCASALGQAPPTPSLGGAALPGRPRPFSVQISGDISTDLRPFSVQCSDDELHASPSCALQPSSPLTSPSVPQMRAPPRWG